jgi:hypothetical protein
MEKTSIVCKNCGNQFSGKYCNNCGEKVYSEHDKTLSHLFEEAFHFITHFDSKFFRTLWKVFTKPGFVSKEFCDGIRKKYFKPVSLFLIGVVIYLIFPVLRGLNINFGSHISQYKVLHLPFMLEWASATAAHKHITLEQLAYLFNQKSEKVSKLLLVILIPLTGLLLNAIFPRRTKKYFDHFILAAEINTFYLYFTFLLAPVILNVVFRIASLFGAQEMDYGDNFWSILFFTVPMLLFVAASLKRFYELKTLRTVLKSLLFLIGHMFIVYFLYRIILYSIVMLLI